MSESESYYSDEYSYDEQDGKAQDQKEEKEPSKPAGMMEWILRGGALANGNLHFLFVYFTVNNIALTDYV